jgi:hypothetical protein
MMEKNSAGMLCTICGAPATAVLLGVPVCDNCSKNPEVVEQYTNTPDVKDAFDK